MSKTKSETLKFYKLDPSVKDPYFATEGSACFDIHATIIDGTSYQVNQDTLSKTIERPV